jgi:hypothetical protein
MIFKVLLSIVVCLIVAFWGYTEVIGFSAALPWPSFLETSSISDWWLFHIATMLIPYLVLIGLASFFAARYAGYWIAPLCVVGVLWYLRGLVYSEEFRYVLFSTVILILSISSYFGHKQRNQALKKDADQEGAS